MTGLDIRKSLLFLVLFPVAPLAQAQDFISRVAGPDALSFFVFIAFVLIIVGLPLYFANRRDRRKQELYLRFVELGHEIPKELLPRGHSRRSSYERELVRGVWLSCLGVGLGLVLYIVTQEWRMAAWSLILLFLGAASFINAMLIGRNTHSGASSDDDA
ncbi:MAG: DUF6249 domain-containing protein [Gammaproteobacteria bacterium]|nr:DUF6249 domain-containing protein [Gammaproteobacteria bacterium]